MASSSSQPQGARYFGQTSPKELKDLEKNAAKATPKQLAKACAYLQMAFSGQYYAWFGGWAINLRGSRRDTRDIDLLVLAASNTEIRATLAPCDWAIMSYYELPGSIQERVFVDISENGQVVGADIVLSGALNTPTLGDDDSYELLNPSIKIPGGDQIPVISLAWQVEGKLAAWMSRKKSSDFEDLVFLFEKYGNEIREWAQHLPQESLAEFYVIFEVSVDSKRCKAMKKTLGLE